MKCPFISFTFLLGLIMPPVCCNAQSGTWIWMNGDTLINTAGTYGVQGVASPNNSPPGLYQSAQWTDLHGNLWIFGGLREDTTGTGQVEESDLWKFNPASNMWTWVRGDSLGLDIGVYGTQGIPAPANTPGARAHGCAAWTDTAGDLWLFAGQGPDSLGLVGSLSDLWRYHIATNEWAWMGGPAMADQPGVYGNLYQASNAFWPPARHEINTAWTDANNNLWLLDGYRGDSSFSDLWRYSIGNGEWAWMGGSQQMDQKGSYGTMGVESATNMPDARNSYTHWTDNQYLYFTGGGNFETLNMYNDVWRFNTQTNYWAWVGGDSGNAPIGQYTHYCSTSYNDKPVGRYELRSTQINGCSPVLFMMGGTLSRNPGDSMLNDLWCFDLRAQKWKWISGYGGVSFAGNYGTKGVAAASNMPPGLKGPCFWTDNNHNLWLWGGWKANDSVQYAFLNAMWKYIPDTTCLPADTGAPVIISASKTILCPGDTAKICAPAGFYLYTWSNGDTGNCINTTDAGNYYATLTANGFCQLGTNTVTIGFFPPLPVTVSVTGDTLTAIGANNYQWYLNGAAIAGATSSVYIAQAPGTYTLQVIDTNGCPETSTPVLITGIIEELSENSITLYPNPSTGNWQLTVPPVLIGSTVEVFNTTGQIVFKSEIRNSQSEIAIPNIASGVYELRIYSGSYIAVRKLVKM